MKPNDDMPKVKHVLDDLARVLPALRMAARQPLELLAIARILEKDALALKRIAHLADVDEYAGLPARKGANL